ncbi:MAG: hypothetical protein JHC93_06185 [Parachlamydiales bacterium]|nr:hypothetical protein [Parachlamydiales bacterium]
MSHAIDHVIKIQANESNNAFRSTNNDSPTTPLPNTPLIGSLQGRSLTWDTKKIVAATTLAILSFFGIIIGITGIAIGKDTDDTHLIQVSSWLTGASIVTEIALYCIVKK